MVHFGFSLLFAISVCAYCVFGVGPRGGWSTVRLAMGTQMAHRWALFLFFCGPFFVEGYPSLKLKRYFFRSGFC